MPKRSADTSTTSSSPGGTESPAAVKDPVSSRSAQAKEGTSADQESPTVEARSKSDPQRRRKFLRRLAGSFIYIYFALFVVFHAAVGLIFFLDLMNPWTGLLLWLVVAVLGGFSVVALALWREELSTFWE